ncbi:hypothetical protein YC2023_029423 [Brassica napus]
MSEDSDEARFCEDRTSTSSSQPESRPTSHVLPYRYQRPLTFQVQGKAMLTVKRECAWKKIIERKISLTLSKKLKNLSLFETTRRLKTITELQTIKFCHSHRGDSMPHGMTAWKFVLRGADTCPIKPKRSDSLKICFFGLRLIWCNWSIGNILGPT